MRGSITSSIFCIYMKRSKSNIIIKKKNNFDYVSIVLVPISIANSLIDEF